MLYDGFISYSHAKDRALAKRLQRTLQSLGKPWYQRRSLNIFRDETSLSANPDLWNAIEHSLTNSRFLILFASPDAAQSHWVNKEVEYWISSKSLDTLLIALTDGNLTWDTNNNTFISRDKMLPLPPALHGRFPAEPLWVDLRDYRDNATRARQKSDAFVSLAANFAAPLRGIPKEDLISEELQQQRRLLRLAYAAVGVVSLLLVTSIALTIVSIQQRNRAEHALTSVAATIERVSVGVAGSLRDRPGTPRPVINEMLQHTEKLIANMLAASEERPDFIWSAARSYLELSQLRFELGDALEAERAADAALRLARRLKGSETPAGDVQRLTGASLGQLAIIQRSRGLLSESAALLTEATALGFGYSQPERSRAVAESGCPFEKIHSLSHRLATERSAYRASEAQVIVNQLESALSSCPKQDHTGGIGIIVGAHAEIGSFLCEGNNQSRGMAHMSQALLYESVMNAVKGSLEAQRLQASVYWDAAKCLRKLNRLDEARHRINQAEGLSRASAALGSDVVESINLGPILLDHAKILRQSSRLNEAKAKVTEAIEILGNQSTKDKANIVFKRNLALALQERGLVTMFLGQRLEAKQHFKEAIGHFNDIVTNPDFKDSSNAAIAEMLYGLSSLGDQPLANIRAARAIWRGLAEHSHFSAEARRWLSVSAPFEKQFEATQAADDAFARRDFKEAARLRRDWAEQVERNEIAVVGTAKSDSASAWGTYSYYALLANEPAAALAASEKGLRFDPTLLWITSNKAHALLLMGQTDDAIAAYLEHRGKVVSGKPWAELIANDFRELNSAGVSHPQMTDIIEKLGGKP